VFRSSRTSRSSAPQLGPLERAVLDHLFECDAASVVAVHDVVGAARGVSRNTVHSTLERLVRKRLAERRKRGRAYEYRALGSRREWLVQSLASLLDALPGTDSSCVVASFVDLAERAGPESLRELEARVRERRLRERERVPGEDGT
jgi:predicted transcriptional regulator